MSVTRHELERGIARLRAELTDAGLDPDAGIYGPGSISWQVNRESALFLCGGRAALLQLAHPFVAHAIDQHSKTKTDPVGRFLRTFRHVFRMAFGSLDQAIDSARRIHAVHGAISGTITGDAGRYRAGSRYDANDEAALLWVYATLVDTALLAHDMFVRPLGTDEKELYYEESKRFTRLFGLRDAALPPDWSAFQTYWHEMLASDVITPSAPAREIARFLFSPPIPLRPLAVWGKSLTAGLLPARVRRGYELPFGRVERAVFSASVGALHQAYRRVPGRLRFVPAYVLAERRLAGKQGHDLLGRVIDRVAQTALDARAATRRWRKRA